MASPLVAGLLGLIASANPGGTMQDWLDCLISTANENIYDPVLHPNNIPGTLGTGNIDAFDGLRCILGDCNNPFATITAERNTICPGTSVTLRTNEGTAYVWSTTETTRDIQVNQAGTYSVTVTFVGGCTAEESITMDLASPNAEIFLNDGTGLLGNDGIACNDPGQASSEGSITITAFWGNSYLWNFANSTTPEISIFAAPPFTYNYSVTVTDVQGCAGATDVLTGTVGWIENPVITIDVTENSGTANDGTICDGTSAILEADGAGIADDYAWSTGESINPITVTPSVTTTYAVIGADINGCEDDETVQITVDDCDGEYVCNCPNVIGNGGIIQTNAGGIFSSGNVNITGSCIAIDGTLIVNSNLTVTGGEIEILPGSSVEVSSSFSLDLINVNENGGVHACDEMWQGILVNDFGQLNIQGTTIQNAINAVEVHDQSRLTINGSIFRNNRVGVFTPPLATGQVQFVNANISAQFICDQDLLPPFNGQRALAGVSLNNTTTMVIGGFWGTPATNTFTGLERGVIANNCNNILIQNATMNDLVNLGVGVLMEDSEQMVIDNIGVSTTSFGVDGTNTHTIIRNSNINTTRQGINLRNGPGRSVFAGNNVIDSRRAGISIIGYTGNEIRLDNNTITKTTQPLEGGIQLINCSPNEVVINQNVIDFDQASGIIMLGCSGHIRVDNNTLNCTGTGQQLGLGMTLQETSDAFIYNNTITATNGGQLTDAISVINSPSNFYCCNTVSNATNGIGFYGNCGATDLRSSTFGQHVNGLLLQSAIIGRQEMKGNFWTNSVNTWDASHLGGTPALIVANRFETDFSNLSSGLSGIQVDAGLPSDWFLPLTNDPSQCAVYYCGETPQPEPPANPECEPHCPSEKEISEFDEIIAGDDILTTALVEGFFWRGQNRLMHKLIAYPELVEHSEDIAQFYGQHGGEDLEDFVSIRSQLDHLIEPRVDDDLAAFRESLAIAAEEIQSILEVIGVNTMPLSSEASSKLQQLITITNQEQTASKSFKEGIQAQANILRTKNALLTEHKSYQLYEKRMNDYLLGAIVNDDFDFSPAEQTIINAIADLCGYEEGYGVEKAKALQTYYGGFNDLGLNCYIPSGNQNGSAKNGIVQNTQLAAAFTVYPNPAQFLITIESPLSGFLPTDRVSIELFDASGRSVWTQQYNAQALYEIAIDQFSNGLYFINLSTDREGVVYTSKITILR